MSIVEQQLVNIEIVNIPGKKRSDLRLNYQNQTYHLCQAFTESKLTQAQQQLQQLKLVHGDRYLLVREVGYYSLWEIDGYKKNIERRDLTNGSETVMESAGLEMQQASLCFFQELWFRLEDLIGARQLELLANDLFAAVPALKSVLDLDRLLKFEPLSTDRLTTWTADDFRILDREIDLLTQKKLGRKFGSELVQDTIESIPTQLRSLLADI